MYDIKRGGLWAHILWLFSEEPGGAELRPFRWVCRGEAFEPLVIFNWPSLDGTR